MADLKPFFIKEHLEAILSDYKDLSNFFVHNKKIHRVYNGDLLGIMEEEALKFNSAQARKDNKDMAVAMNYLPKIIDHKSQLYTFEIDRQAATNQDLVEQYIKLLQIDTHMGNANKYYNASKSVLVEIYQDRKMNLKIRPLPNDRFFVWTNDPVEPNKPTAYIKVIDTIKIASTKGGKPNKEVDLLHIYTDSEFMAVTSCGTQIQSYKINDLGVAPFIYINQESYSLIPTASRDTLQNIIKVNEIMTNANVCSFYQSHPIRVITGMDAPPSNLSINPNDFLFLNAKEGSTVTPTVDELASTLDVSKSIALAKEILEQTLFINDISAKDAVKSNASGISLQLQDTDIVENRKDQIEQFRPAEEELWEKIGLIHNKLIELKRVGAKMPVGRFASDFSVEVDFPTPDTNAEIKQAGSNDPAATDSTDTLD